MARARTVFAVPGTSSKRTCPRQISAARTSWMRSVLPWTTVSTFSSNRSAVFFARARRVFAVSIGAVILFTVAVNFVGDELRPRRAVGQRRARADEEEPTGHARTAVDPGRRLRLPEHRAVLRPEGVHAAVERRREDDVLRDRRTACGRRPETAGPQRAAGPRGRS